MTKIDLNAKKVVYTCWNDKAHANGEYMWESVPLPQDCAACPVCGEVVKITKKL